MLDEEPLPFGPWWHAYRRLVEGPDDPPLVTTALAFSHILQGGYPWPGAEGTLQTLEQRAAEQSHGTEPRDAARAIVDLLVDEGFAGDEDTYEDPANSLLDRVLERRRGLPIALSVLAVHLAGHAGVPLRGIGFPGHFVVGVEVDGDRPLVLDPFGRGRVLDGPTLSAMLARVTGQTGDWRRFARPASNRDIVARMLRNLVMHLRASARHLHAEAAQTMLRMTATPRHRGAPGPD